MFDMKETNGQVEDPKICPILGMRRQLLAVTHENGNRNVCKLLCKTHINLILSLVFTPIIPTWLC